MKQLNVNVTQEFERDLQAYMQSRKIARKSDAIRQALREAAERSAGHAEYDFRNWLGLGLKSPVSQKRRFHSEDELWS
jgi:Arc/MetJ-type ribon-helix-helix transcriptional regulator